jgi:hypothetical protein
MHGDAHELVANSLDFAHVYTDPNVYPDGADCVADCDRARHSARRSLERDEEPVTGRVDLVAVPTANLVARRVEPLMSVNITVRTSRRALRLRMEQSGLVRRTRATLAQSRLTDEDMTTVPGPLSVGLPARESLRGCGVHAFEMTTPAGVLSPSHPRERTGNVRKQWVARADPLTGGSG